MWRVLVHGVLKAVGLTIQDLGLRKDSPNQQQLGDQHLPAWPSHGKPQLGQFVQYLVWLVVGLTCFIFPVVLRNDWLVD